MFLKLLINILESLYLTGDVSTNAKIKEGVFSHRDVNSNIDSTNLKSFLMNKTPYNLENSIQGTWWLLTREDYTKDGQRRTDPILGSDPIAILVYAKNHFAAQFMKKDRSPDSIAQITNAGQNNTGAIGGYDAYFGIYQIDKQKNQVAHTLLGSINPSNIGMTVYRNLTVEEDQLTIQLDTTTLDGEAITRTLLWKRIT